MRIDILILTSVIAAVVKQKDSCNSKNQVTPPKMPDANPEKSFSVEKAIDLLVIGAGAQADTFLGYLAKTKKLGYHMVVLEKKTKYGLGLPYDKDVLTPEHVLHSFGPGTFTITSDPLDFLKWLKANPGYILKLGSLRPSQLAKSPPPRYLIGKYLSDRFHQYVAKCGGNGYKIDLISNTSAENITRGESGFAVKLSNGNQLNAKNIFLATGYWDKRRFDTEVKGYFKSPWPASDLLEIPANQHIGIFGTSLSAIDAALTLAHKFGKFKRVRGNLVYQLFEKGNMFNMTMYSRSGQFPEVGGEFQNFELSHMTDHGMEALKQYENNRHFIPLTDVFDLMKKDFMRIGPLLQGFSDLNPAAFLKQLETLRRFHENPIQRLRAGINEVRTKDNFSARLKVLFLKVTKAFNKIAKYFLAEDMMAFKTEIAPKILKFGVPMAFSNAEKMLALMEAGRLNLEGVGGECEFIPMQEENEERVAILAGVRLECGKSFEHRFFVDAGGQSDDIESDSSTLTQSLLESKLIQPLCIPYREQGKGGEANVKSSKIQFINGEYCYKAGGIEMNMDTMRVIPPRQTSTGAAQRLFADGVIYASGPYVYGRYPFAQSLTNVARFGELIVRDIMNSY